MTGFSPPTVTGFTTWLRNNGFNEEVLPSNSQYIGWAFAQAMQEVNQQINLASPLIYTLCVYNLGASILIYFCPDQEPSDDPPSFFNALRKKWNIDDPVTGLVQATSDEGSSTSLVVPEQLKTLTIANLQQFKDPYGRWYLGKAQSVGNLWGLT